MIKHLPEYLMEAAGLCIFMIIAGLITVILEYPASVVHQFFPDPMTRRALNGIVVGLTGMILIYYPWGQQSGAHYNPAITLTFFRLGKVKGIDAFYYCLFQFLGGILGTVILTLLLGNTFTASPVFAIATFPGQQGIWAAFIAEALISFILLLCVFFVTNTAFLSRYIGIFVGGLLFIFIFIEAPFSGMSLNPARTIASAIVSGRWEGIWVYLCAPIGGMLLAVEVYHFMRKEKNLLCAKLNHVNKKRCIFLRCGYKSHQ